MNRPSDHGRDGDEVDLTVDGTPLRVPASRTVAAVLMMEQHRRSWRRTHDGAEDRGLFCGIGVCFDCLATVDGRRSLRTCMVEVSDGMVVQTSTPNQEENRE